MLDLGAGVEGVFLSVLGGWVRHREVQLEKVDAGWRMREGAEEELDLKGTIRRWCRWEAGWRAGHVLHERVNQVRAK